MITTIRRPTKLEAVKAMNALVERGFEIEKPLQQIKLTSEQRGNWNYRRLKYESKGTNIITCWYVQLRGVKRNG